MIGRAGRDATAVPPDVIVVQHFNEELKRLAPVKSIWPPTAILSVMGFDDYKTVLYRQDGAWVAEIPALPGCYALMPTRDEALAELQQVFEFIAEEYRQKGRDLPSDTTEIVNA